MKAAKPKILLVDDRNENLLALEVILSNQNYECVKANSGREALKALLQEPDFSIILMDVQMPILDGFETAKLIRESEKFKHVPIIFLTGNMITPEDIFKGYQTGAVDYMIKPLSAEILKAKVAVFVDLHEKNKELLAQEENLKNLNSQLKKQSQYVRSLIEASLDPLVTINSEGVITDVNAAMESIVGISRNEIVNTPFANHFTNAVRAEVAYKETFEKGTIVDYLLTFCHKDGTLIDVLCNGSVYKDDKGEIEGVVIVAREKLLSKYASSIIEASLDPLITINFDGKITDINEALVNVTGISREEIIGTNFFDYYTSQPKAAEVYERIFAKGYIINFPLTLRHKNGKLTDVLFNGSVYKDNRGRIAGAVIVARDVTAQKIVEKELIEAKSKAEEAMQAKQQFLSNMSHEIRTPMNAIIGFTKLALKTNLNEQQKEYLNAIKVSGDTLIVLINDILDLAKVDAGKMTFEQIPFKLTESISTILHLFENKAQEKNLELIKQYDLSIPKYLVGDSVRLHQIILNLLSNAIKFTKEGKVTVLVHLLNEDDEQVTLEFAVIDTGIGIPANKLDKIFDKFQQATDSTERLYGGTGLGLAIVKQLVEAQGGNIITESKVGKGSTFKFILSFKKIKGEIEKEIKKEIELERAQNNHIEEIGLKNINILVAEDVKYNQILMQTLLKELGFSADIAANGKVVIEMLSQRNLNGASPYDIILMDLHMPEMNGYQATEYIRKKMKLKIPIIALTADVTTADLEKCKKSGMNDYISKPIDDKLLFKKITKHIRKFSLKKSNSKGKAKPTTKVKQISTPKSINLENLKELTNSKPEMMLDIMKVYLEEIPKQLQALQQAIDAKDWQTIEDTAHAIIPSFALVGIDAEYEQMARTIQDYCREKRELEPVKELFAKIDHVCNQAMEELKQELS